MATHRKKRIAPPKDGARVAVYVRRSVADEGRSKSCDQQVDQCLLACAGLGFQVPPERIYREIEGAKGDWWFDDGTGSKPGPYRPELSRLVRDIRQGNIDRLIVWRTDRIFRHSGIAHELLEIMREAGTRLYVKTTDLAIHTASGLQNAMTEAAANRGYRDKIGEDIKRDKDYKAALGLITGNASCYGFRSRKNGSRKVDPVWEELDVVEKVFTWFVHGDGESGPMNRGAIARRLMTEGASLATSARGHRARNASYVSEQRVKTLLRNPMYAGRWQYDGVARECEALLVSRSGEDRRPAIPVELYDAAQARLQGYATTPSRTSASEKRPLAGLVLCGVCGRPMHANVGKMISGERTPRWFCPYRSRGECEGPGYAGVRVQVLDDWAKTYLADMIRCEYLAMRAESSVGSLQSEIFHLESQLDQHRRDETLQLKRALSLLDDEQYGALAAEMRAERVQLEGRLLELRSRAERNRAVDVENLRGLSEHAFGAAVRRCVRWIAVTERGVVVLTAWGVYIGAAFGSQPVGRLVRAGDHRQILPPGVLATRDCLSWLPNHERFVVGQQSVRGSRFRGAPFEAILPASQGPTFELPQKGP